MPFAKKDDALMKNGKLKKGFTESLGKDGKTRYLRKPDPNAVLIRKTPKTVKPVNPTAKPDAKSKRVVKPKKVSKPDLTETDVLIETK